MLIKYYRPPDGRVVEIEVKNINPEEQDYFEKHNYEMSIEELIGGQIAVYARAPQDTDGEKEVVVLSFGRSCQETMVELAEECRRVYGLV